MTGRAGARSGPATTRTQTGAAPGMARWVLKIFCINSNLKYLVNSTHFSGLLVAPHFILFFLIIGSFSISYVLENKEDLDLMDDRNNSIFK